MGWRGRHHRNWIYVETGFNHDSQFEAELLHEEPCEIYGLFGVVCAPYTENWYVIWRPNRNYTQWFDIKVMSREPDRYGHSTAYDSLEEATDSIEYWLANFVPPEKHKRHRPRDSQKNKLYTWEHVMATEIGPKEIGDGPVIKLMTREYNTLERKRSKTELHAMLRHVCTTLGEKEPPLKFRTGGSCSYAGTDIRLLPVHCTYTVLLHELSHILHKRWGKETDGKRHQAHGQEFVGIFAYMFIRFGGIDKRAIIGHAVKAKIKLLLPKQYWDWNESREAA
jgi:hypothetical protein